MLFRSMVQLCDEVSERYDAVCAQNGWQLKLELPEEELPVYADPNMMQVGVTHLLVDGKENLMDGQPYLTAEGALVMEVNALIPHITGTRTQYDDKVNVLRIETE